MAALDNTHMRILRERPPNFERIAEALPGARGDNILFAYGNAIFNPSGVPVPHMLYRHECMHSYRQGLHPGGPDAWWENYIISPRFRFAEELPAHAVEYATYKQMVKGDEKRKGYLRRTAQRLVGPLYRVEGVSVAEARRMMLESAKCFEQDGIV